ncbi:MAG: hypothetical protein BroJett042_11580 [Bacteroidota bacterium]|nr:MAG: hypothetical protein BroJett042_11580 [Bacteroidota bacterium]
MKKYISYILTLGVLAAACKPSERINQVVGVTKTASFVDTRWALIELEEKPVDLENKPYLVFAAKSMVVSGFGGCNQLGGSYESSGQKLKLNNMAATHMYCHDSMEVETAFFQSLQKINQYKIEGHELMLLQDDKVIARFRVIN